MYFTPLALAALLSLTIAAPVASEEKRAPTTIKPIVISEYYVKTGRIAYNLQHGHIYKTSPNNGDDRTTLVTFDIPASAAGKTCSIGLDLDGPTSTLTGSKLVDVYTSLAPAPGNRNAWGPGNQRNLAYGRLSVVDGGSATWKSDVPAPGKAFACPPKGRWAIELVGVYDDDEVVWDKAMSGPYVRF
ncbi:hypothetical protein BDV96DRAFT_582701 [Lophiotrema nucula]|uniref:Ubiquitin 3 binding protein But2 C-terminal domain-containing protein n=1 Tax=Lophiotrema nucula TaxID=690887 RepID=A0A6A5YX58_9PLEO|nr:hypothetical protein BDV96DRAFT_582701 [Lophiotrema nucula]